MKTVFQLNFYVLVMVNYNYVEMLKLAIACRSGYSENWNAEAVDIHSTAFKVMYVCTKRCCVE